MNNLFVKLILPILLLSFIGTVHSESSKSDKDLYELQEKCGKTTGDEFKKEWGNGIVNDKESQMISKYVNHYNKRMNKCFYLLTTSTYPKNKKQTSVEMRGLWDIQENKSYGELDIYTVGTKLFICNVEETQCSSKQQWETLIKPYMND